jgi:hypothetical protein
MELSAVSRLLDAPVCGYGICKLFLKLQKSARAPRLGWPSRLSGQKWWSPTSLSTLGQPFQGKDDFLNLFALLPK